MVSSPAIRGSIPSPPTMAYPAVRTLISVRWKKGKGGVARPQEVARHLAAFFILEYL